MIFSHLEKINSRAHPSLTIPIPIVKTEMDSLGRGVLLLRALFLRCILLWLLSLLYKPLPYRFNSYFFVFSEEFIFLIMG